MNANHDTGIPVLNREFVKRFNEQQELFHAQQSRIGELQRELDSLRNGRAQQTQQENTDFEEERQSLQATIAALQSELDGLKSAASEGNADLDKRIKDSEQSNERLKSRLSQTQSDLTDIRSQLEATKTELFDVSRDRDKKAEALRRAEKKLREKSTAGVPDPHQPVSEDSAQLADLKIRNRELEERIGQLNTKYRLLNMQVKSLKKRQQ